MRVHPGHSSRRFGTTCPRRRIGFSSSRTWLTRMVKLPQNRSTCGFQKAAMALTQIGRTGRYTSAPAQPPRRPVVSGRSFGRFAGPRLHLTTTLRGRFLPTRATIEATWRNTATCEFQLGTSPRLTSPQVGALAEDRPSDRVWTATKVARARMIALSRIQT